MQFSQRIRMLQETSFIVFSFWNTRHRFSNFRKLIPTKAFLNCEEIISAMRNRISVSKNIYMICKWRTKHILAAAYICYEWEGLQESDWTWQDSAFQSWPYLATNIKNCAYLIYGTFPIWIPETSKWNKKNKFDWEVIPKCGWKQIESKITLTALSVKVLCR